MIPRRKFAVRNVCRVPSLFPSLAELGLALTIGIAAKPPGTSAYIATVTDMRIGLGDNVPGVDIARVKLSRLDAYWGFLFASNETGYIRPIAEKARATLAAIHGRRSLAQAVTAVVDAYQSVRSDVVFQRYLQQYGYASMEDFRQNPGFTPEVIGALMKEMDDFDLGVVLLLYGFDEKGEAHFVQIQNPGEQKDRDDLDWWAVGSGFSMAMSAMNRRSPADYSVEALVYRCCEAKFIAEFAQDVGKATAVIVWYPDGTYAILMSPQIDKLREIYEWTRKESIPSEAKRLIEEQLEFQKQRRAAEVEQ